MNNKMRDSMRARLDGKLPKTVEDFLCAIGLPQYSENFADQGVLGMDQLMTLDTNELEVRVPPITRIGVEKSFLSFPRQSSLYYVAQALPENVKKILFSDTFIFGGENRREVPPRNCNAIVIHVTVEKTRSKKKRKNGERMGK